MPRSAAARLLQGAAVAHRLLRHTRDAPLCPSLRAEVTLTLTLALTLTLTLALTLTPTPTPTLALTLLTHSLRIAHSSLLQVRARRDARLSLRRAPDVSAATLSYTQLLPFTTIRHPPIHTPHFSSYAHTYIHTYIHTYVHVNQCPYK